MKNNLINFPLQVTLLMISSAFWYMSFVICASTLGVDGHTLSISDIEQLGTRGFFIYLFLGVAIYGQILTAIFIVSAQEKECENSDIY